MRQARWRCVSCHAEVFTKAESGNRCPACGGGLITTTVPRAFSGPTLAERAAAWDRDDPDELRRAADEWEALGATRYADHLRTRAGGGKPDPAPEPVTGGALRRAMATRPTSLRELCVTWRELRAGA